MKGISTVPWWSGLDDDIYCGLEDVDRRENSDLHLRRDGWPDVLKLHVKAPTAVLARHLASPNYEMLWFSRLARRNGLRTLVIEHASDIFTVNNPAKLALVALPIVTGRDANGKLMMRRQLLARSDAAEGRPLEDIETQTGESLRSYHHRKLDEVLGNDRPDLIDLREMFSADDLRPSSYYHQFFKMLSGPLVLLEDFVVDSRTASFFNSTVLPAWQRAYSELGRRPQIARLGPDRRASSPIWNAYPITASESSMLARRPDPVGIYGSVTQAEGVMPRQTARSGRRRTSGG